MKPKLILLNGNPGMGKSTLAQRYVDNHPLAMNLDIDRIWFTLGQWQHTRPKSDELKYTYAYALAEMHLAAGYDVVIPQIESAADRFDALEQIAAQNNADFKELVLHANLEDAIERCKRRAQALGYPEGFRPGGVLDMGGRERMLQNMYENMLGATALRPNTIRIESVDGDIDGTYQALVEALAV